MLTIPPSLESILKKDNKLHSIVISTVIDFSELIEENKLYFFEEFTNHGILHINNLLETCETLIDRYTLKNLIRPLDVCTLILSILVHDVGMHISFQSFVLMLNGEFDQYRVEELDDKTWAELWAGYVIEAKKFDYETLRNIFGQDNSPVNIPDLNDQEKLDNHDKKLIGEFVRRNHPRIAHEIALGGFIGSFGKIEFAPELDIDIKNIIGVIARSHGLNLRSLFDYLKSLYDTNWMAPYQIHIVYNMILLRLGDILQIHSDRIPSYIFKLYRFTNHISYDEFLKHNSIKHFSPSFSDKETLHIQCTPPNSRIYKGLTMLFELIQEELDKSWAILGEIYGNLSENERPLLTLRRIKSNLDDLNKFSKTVDYVPDYIVLDIEPNIIKLLIAPLYGNNPTFGVRELIQNSVDACNERKILDDEKSNEYVGQIDIKVYKEQSQDLFEISDNGKGMNVDEIKRYFFKVGSSYRQSKDWNTQFISEDNNARIPRIGKFGVGILAGFLLGMTMEIKTRRYDESIGYVFYFNLNLKNVEIAKEKNVKVGTSIIIKIHKNIAEFLKNNYKSTLQDNDANSESNSDRKIFTRYSDNDTWTSWFTLDNPKLFIQLYGTVIQAYKNPDPGFDQSLQTEWCELYIDGCEKVNWTYSPKYSKKKLTINGIVIPHGYKIESNYIRNEPFSSVFDFKGNINVSLNRSSIENNRLPFNDILRGEIYKHLLAKILVAEFKTNFILVNKEKIVNLKLIQHPAFGNIQLLYNSKGFIVNLPAFFKKYYDSAYLSVQKFFLPQTNEFKSIGNFFIHLDSSDRPQNMFLQQKKNEDVLEFSLRKKEKKKDRDIEFANEREDKYFFKTIKLSQESQEVFELYEGLLGVDWIIPFDIYDRKRKFEKAFYLLDYYIKNLDTL